MEPADRAQAGVVDPYVDGAKALHGGAREAPHGVRVGHVGCDRNRLAAQPCALADRILERSGAARGQHEPGPAPREGVRRRPADPARAAGDHHDQIAHVHRRVPRLYQRRRRDSAMPTATPASAASPSSA